VRLALWLACLLPLGVAVDAAADPEDEPWELMTLTPGVFFTPLVCEWFAAGYTVPYHGTSCEVTLGAAVVGQVRPVRPLLFEADLLLGFFRDSDREFLHLGNEHTEPMPWTEGLGQLRFAAGLALRVPDGEMRVTLGPRFAFRRLSDDTLDALVTQGTKPDTISQYFAGVELAWALDGVPAPPIRIGPRFAVGVARRVLVSIYDPSNEDWRIYRENRTRYTDISLRPGLGMSFPGTGPVAFSFELAPVIRVRTYSDEAYEELLLSMPHHDLDINPDKTDVDVGGYLLLGVQLRLGRVQ